MNLAAKIQIRSIFTLANSSGRASNLCGRKADKIYGVEDGHGEKNEVRKEKWIKKKVKKDRGDYLGHICGEDYRVKNGYMKKQNLFVVDVFSNWSDADSGLPGPSTAMQRVRKLKNLQLAEDVFEAAMLVKRAQNIKTE